ncbi:MAG: hypothetical protein P8Y10_02870 [Gemmatimonadales bacterium]|jgi:hypothetical protein
MTFRTLLVTKALVCLAFGLLLLLVPVNLLATLGAELGTAGTFTAREYGAALIGALFVMWFAKDVKAPDARLAILLYLLVYDAIGVIITVPAVLSGVLNGLGWGIALVYLFFALGAGYVLGQERKRVTAS